MPELQLKKQSYSLIHQQILLDLTDLTLADDDEVSLYLVLVDGLTRASSMMAEVWLVDARASSIT